MQADTLKSAMSHRWEKDSLGERKLSADSLYGISSLRGAENFNISGHTIAQDPSFIRALMWVKKSAALANKSLGVYAPEKADAIAAACDAVLAGHHHEHFIINILEGSGGTSINMNVNEVLANIALCNLGHEPGAYHLIHPNDHVNNGQSTNDVIPSALKLAIYSQSEGLVDSLFYLANSLSAKSREFEDVLRMGRTCMQAAQPMTLGQAFGGYAAGVRRGAEHLRALRDDLLVLPLGGTAIGTGLGCAPGYREAVYGELQRITGWDVRMADDIFDGMQNSDTFSRFSGELRIIGDLIGKIAGDLIILSSGPNSGIGEITLPAVQAGSSIMPGKVNPVMPMMMQQIAFLVTGNDTAVSMAALGGQLEINHFEPIMASRLFESIEILEKGTRLFAEKCIAGLEANREASLDRLLKSSTLATVFVPKLGYAKVSEIVKRSAAENRPFMDLAIEAGLITENDVMSTLVASTRYRKAS